MTPRQCWDLDERITAIRSSVIVCNHRSYLDPLLLIALLERSKTVVKPIFFRIPILGWVMRTAGYFPATATGKFAGLWLAQMETMGAYLAGGGNLFIFPEGSRSRNGSIGTLNQGALKIARQCRAPVYVLCLRNTDKLFSPGTFFFSTRIPYRISLRLLDHIDPRESQQSLPDLTTRICQIFEHGQLESVPQGGSSPLNTPQAFVGG